MWFVITALASIGTSLVMGRLLARASAEQTSNPHPVRGPSLEGTPEVDRLAIARHALRKHAMETAVHLN